MLLLDESQEVLMLVTNSLQKSVTLGRLACLTFCFQRHETLGSICDGTCSLRTGNWQIFLKQNFDGHHYQGDIGSQDICRDLCGEVELLTTNSNSYIRKKAALCAVRICRKCPEMIENFVERLPPMLSDRNHGERRMQSMAEFGLNILAFRRLAWRSDSACGAVPT